VIGKKIAFEAVGLKDARKRSGEGCFIRRNRPRTKPNTYEGCLETSQAEPRDVLAAISCPRSSEFLETTSILLSGRRWQRLISLHAFRALTTTGLISLNKIFFFVFHPRHSSSLPKHVCARMLLLM
jgi:hypothetical protein